MEDGCFLLEDGWRDGTAADTDGGETTASGGSTGEVGKRAGEEWLCEVAAKDVVSTPEEGKLSLRTNLAASRAHRAAALTRGEETELLTAAALIHTGTAVRTLVGAVGSGGNGKER